MKDPNAVKLGSKGGKSKSSAKAAAARLNGKKGGRPHERHWACKEQNTCCVCNGHTCFKGLLKEAKVGTGWRKIG